MDEQDIDLSDLPDKADTKSLIDLSNLPDKGNIPYESSDSLISRIYKKVTTPLSTLPSTVGKSISKWIDPQQGTTGLRSIASAFAESLGNVGSEMTNPLNLATAAMTGGESLAAKAGLSGIAKAMNIGSKVTGIPTALHGAGEVVNPNSTLAERGMGLVDMGMGSLPFLHRGGGKLSEISDSAISNHEIIPSVKTPEVLSPEESQMAQWYENSGFNDYFGEKNVTPNKTPSGNITNEETDNLIQSLNKPKESGGTSITQSPSEPTAIYIKKPDPAVIKQVMQKGYVFNSLRDDGAFKMVKSDKSVTNLPTLESEVGTSKPTPANAARMMTPNGVESSLGGPKKPSALTEAFNFPRAVMASMDFSAPLRQGLSLIHKKQFWTSLDDMFKAWGSEKAYQAIQNDILERPLFKPRMTADGPIKSFAEQAGLSLTDLKSLSSREESLMSSWAEKVPGVRRSNRAYTAFLNKLRADTFEDLMNKTGVITGGTTENNLPLARELANFVNTASGRGNLGRLEKSAVTLNTVLFSPRLIASRLTMLNPKYYIMANPAVRKEALKSLFATAAAGTTLTQLGKLAGGTVESDPASSDFGKLKIGNTRLDPYGGFQQYIVAANRLISGRDVSSTSGKEYDLDNQKGPYDPSRLDIIKNFGVSKLHPVLGFAYALLNGQKEMTGQKMNFTTMNPMDNAIGQRFIPMLAQDLYQIAQDDPTLLPVLGGLGAFGAGLQTYGGQ